MNMCYHLLSIIWKSRVPSRAWHPRFPHSPKSHPGPRTLRAASVHGHSWGAQGHQSPRREGILLNSPEQTAASRRELGNEVIENVRKVPRLVQFLVVSDPWTDTEVPRWRKQHWQLQTSTSWVLSGGTHHPWHIPDRHCCHKQPLRPTIHRINMGLNRPIPVQVTSLPHVPTRDWQLRSEAINHLGLARITAQSSRTQRMHLILFCCCGEQTECARCIRQFPVLMYYL